MFNSIVIVDFGMGNIHSIYKKLIRLGVQPIVTSDKNTIETAKKIIIPGVGHFKKAIENLNSLNIIESLNYAVINKKTPIFGICLGMQLMANKSEEGNVNGLGWFDADVVRFSVSNNLLYKIPHTGWNQVKIKKNSMLFKNIPELSEFYFVHSYHYVCNNVQDILCETVYENNFVSAVEKNNIFGVQFHPEKSHTVGEILLKNFLEM